MGQKFDDLVVEYDPIVFGAYKDKDAIIRDLETTIEFLKGELEAEKKLRHRTEVEAEALRKRIEELSKVRKRRTKAELEAEEEVYSEFKQNGIRKARPAEAIRSYEDFASIQKYFLDRGKIRDWMMWTVGVSLGLRVSDLLSLKVRNVMNDDMTFRKYIFVIEKKTSKLNHCLITEAVKEAIKLYFNSVGWKVGLDDYLFQSRKTKGKMYEEYGWKILSDAGKALGLPFVVGSHTMRKSFANIAACVDKSTVDMNTITKIQGLLNHSDQKTTMRYLGTFKDMYDRARIAVSDFVLGKTGIHELVAGDEHTIDEVIAKLDTIEAKFS